MYSLRNVGLAGIDGSRQAVGSCFSTIENLVDQLLGDVLTLGTPERIAQDHAAPVVAKPVLGDRVGEQRLEDPNHVLSRGEGLRPLKGEEVANVE
jgi:hypothetical protein